MQVIFAVSDVARAVDFYERAFGWSRNDRIDYPEYVELLPPDGGALGLYERGGFAQIVGADPAEVPDGRVSPSYLYVRVDDVRAAAESVAAAGGRPLTELAPRSWGDEAAWFADLDGNVVAVAQADPASLSQ